MVPMVQQKSDMRQQVLGEVYGNLTDYDRLLRLLKQYKPDVIYHLAAITPVRLSFEMPLQYQMTNYIGTVNLIHAAMEALGTDFRFIAASTAEVYGENGDIVNTENSNLKPMSPYAVSKAAVDTYIQMCQAVYGLQAVVLRANNTYGRPHSGYFVEQRLEELMRGEHIKLYNSHHLRDYMFFPDHILAYLTVLERGQGVYNISPGELISNIIMVKLMRRVIGSSSTIEEIAPPANRPADHRGINLDAGILRMLGWAPLFTREEGIRMLHSTYFGSTTTKNIMLEGLLRAGLISEKNEELQKNGVLVGG